MTKIQHRRDNATNWASVNPVLGQGELAYNTTDGSFRIGDGTNHWSALAEYQYGAIHYMGVWNASGGSYPSDPEQGQYYVISVAGTISGTVFGVDDWIVYNGLAWNKVNNQVYASTDHAHSSLYQPLDADLTSIAELTGSNGLLKKTAENTWTIDTNTYQPLDATLTALAGVTVTADKLIYGTGSDTFSTTGFTAAARTLLDDTTVAAMRTTLAAASSTVATQKIYVDKAATGTGDGTSWANAFTTIQAAINSLPAIINHAVTILIRKGATPYAENVTVQRTVSAGSITIQGEYYWNNRVASAGSGAGKFNLNATDTGIAAGDKILLMKYTGALGSSRPDDAFIDTVASVNGTEVALTTRTSDTFTTSWQYVIVRTEIKGLTIKSNNTTILGLYLNGGTTTPATIDGVFNPQLQCCICESTTNATIFIKNSQIQTDYAINCVGVVCGASTSGALMFSSTNAGYGVLISNLAIFSGAQNSGSGRGHIYGYSSVIPIYYSFIKGLSGGTADGARRVYRTAIRPGAGCRDPRGNHRYRRGARRVPPLRGPAPCGGAPRARRRQRRRAPRHAHQGRGRRGRPGPGRSACRRRACGRSRQRVRWSLAWSSCCSLGCSWAPSSRAPGHGICGASG